MPAAKAVHLHKKLLRLPQDSRQRPAGGQPVPCSVAGLPRRSRDSSAATDDLMRMSRRPSGPSTLCFMELLGHLQGRSAPHARNQSGKDVIA